MGTASSKGGSHTPTRDPSSAAPPDVNKKGIAALIKPLRAPGIQIRPGQSISEFNVMSLASNLSQRFSVLSGLSFISLVSAPASADTARKKLTRTRYRGGSISGPGKTAWPVAQTELLFLPEFPVGTDQKMQLIFYGEISRGAFGQVFHVQCSSTLQHYAMKVLAKSQVCSLDVVKQVKQEVMIQQMCSHHPFITPLIHHWQTRKLLIVMTEYVAYGELHQLWQSLGTLPENLVALYVAEIAVTIDFLHNAGIIYRDLKMENLLLDGDGHIKLIDFGLAKWLRYGSKTGSICGTLHLMAPEVCLGTWYTHSIDWWSLGVIAYCLVVGRYPVPLQLHHTAMWQAINKCEYSLPEGTSPALVSLIQGLLNRDPAERIHTLHALQQEQIYSNMDLATIVEKKVAPRKLLEEYIESKTRQNFEDFAGLTSTPKRLQKSSEVYPTKKEGINRLSSNPGINHAGMSSPSLLHKGSNPALGFHKRSASSPLLHPGRLGHHESVLKCGSGVGITNGAAIPILQSPLLRLARQHCMSQARSSKAIMSSATETAVKSDIRQHSHSFIDIAALPSTPSPSLLHSQRIRDRKQRYKGSKKQPSLPTLQQENTNTSFDSMRMSSSINEIPGCLEETSSSTSCEKLFGAHMRYGSNDSDDGKRKKRERPRSAEFPSRVSRNSSSGTSLMNSSPPVSSSPVHMRSLSGAPFITTLPTIASSPLPPGTPASTSPFPPSSPLPQGLAGLPTVDTNYFLSSGNSRLLSPCSFQVHRSLKGENQEPKPIGIITPAVIEEVLELSLNNSFLQTECEDLNKSLMDESMEEIGPIPQSPYKHAKSKKVFTQNSDVSKSNPRNSEDFDRLECTLGINSNVLIHSSSSPHIIIPSSTLKAPVSGSNCSNLGLQVIVPALSVSSPPPSDTPVTDEDTDHKSSKFSYSMNSYQETKENKVTNSDSFAEKSIENVEAMKNFVNQVITEEVFDNRVLSESLKNRRIDVEESVNRTDNPKLPVGDISFVDENSPSRNSVLEHDRRKSVLRENSDFSNRLLLNEKDSTAVESIGVVTDLNQSKVPLSNDMDTNIANVSQEECMLSFRRNKERISEFQKSLLSHEQIESSQINHDPDATSTPTLKRRSPSEPQQQQQHTLTRIRTSPLVSHRTQSYTSSSSNSPLRSAPYTPGSPRLPAIRTSPHYRYRGSPGKQYLTNNTGHSFTSSKSDTLLSTSSEFSTQNASHQVGAASSGNELSQCSRQHPSRPKSTTDIENFTIDASFSSDNSNHQSDSYCNKIQYSKVSSNDNDTSQKPANTNVSILNNNIEEQ